MSMPCGQNMTFDSYQSTFQEGGKPQNTLAKN